MVEINLKSDPHQPGRFVPNDVEYRVGGSRWRLVSRPHVWRPPTDVFETEDAVVVRVEIAGMHDAEFSVSLDERYLVVSGVRPDQPERRAYHQMEIRFGEFRTEVELPSAIDAQSVDAEYRDGFLRLVLPKAKPRRIELRK
jgi:HSP20 family protein